MIRKLIKIFFAILMISNAFSLEMGQLPISDKLALTFPKINAICFIIINTKTNLVLHELNSNQEINIGTFKEAISEGKINENFEGGNSNLYDMALQFLKLHQNNFQKDPIFFSSALSGVGCVFVYKNANNAEFICLIHGELSEDLAIEDIKKISEWLDQFYEYEVPESNNQEINIPVLYGTKKELIFEDSKSHIVLLSENLSRMINKISRYRTIIKAPINIGDELGFIFYQTEIFKHPITKIIKSDIEIKKSSWIKCIRDSFLYLIFGSTMRVEKNELPS